MPRPASFSEPVGQRHSPACQYRESYALTTSLRPVVREFRRVLYMVFVLDERLPPVLASQTAPAHLSSARALRLLGNIGFVRWASVPTGISRTGSAGTSLSMGYR